MLAEGDRPRIRENGVVAQCVLVAMLDGFDTQLIAFIAPVLTLEWHLSSIEMGQVLTAGLAGLMLGTVFLGPLGDRIGRRPQLLFSVVFFALCTLASALSTSMHELILLRVLTGIGLGGAVVSCYALAAEFASPGRLAVNVAIVKVGFPAGGALGGFASAYLISAGGWHLVLLIAGMLPLLLLPVLYFQLPESPGFLAQQDRGVGVLQRLLRSSKLRTAGQEKPKSLLTSLFAEGRAGGTILLWSICFLNLLTIYVLVMWLPTLLGGKGFSLTVALYASSLFTVGGAVGGLGFSVIMPRFGPARVLGGGCLAAILGVWALAMSADAGSAIFWSTFVGGVVLGTQLGTVVLLTGYYPVGIRSTGIGWALGIGRIGGVLAPLLGGLVLDAGFSANQLLQVLTVPLAGSALLLVLLARITSRTGHEQVAPAELR